MLSSLLYRLGVYKICKTGKLFLTWQIVVTILQGVTAQFPCRWDEVLEFRTRNTMSPEQATRKLLYDKNQQIHFAQQALQHGGYPPPMMPGN